MKHYFFALAAFVLLVLATAWFLFSSDVSVPSVGEFLQDKAAALWTPGQLGQQGQPRQKPAGPDPTRPAAVHPLPKLLAIIDRQDGSELEALMLDSDYTKRRYKVGDRLPGTDAQITAIDAEGIQVERTTGAVHVAVEPPAPLAEGEDEQDDDPYQQCEGMVGDNAASCHEAVGQRIEELQATCERYEEEDGESDEWQACIRAANQLRPYP